MENWKKAAQQSIQFPGKKIHKNDCSSKNVVLVVNKKGTVVASFSLKVNLLLKDEDRMRKEKNQMKDNIQNQSNASPQLSKKVGESSIQEFSSADKNQSAETSPNKDIAKKSETEKVNIN